jgi:histidinol dehydrogenase
MKIITAEQYQSETKEQTTDLLGVKELDDAVLPIIQQVKTDGDTALRSLTEKFDQVKLDQLLVSSEEIKEAKDLVDDSFLTSLKKAKENIAAFHQLQKEETWITQPEQGITLGQKVTPMDRVGVYVPGGKAAYPSTVLMNVIPAQIAGVGQVVMTTPPGKDGKVNPYVLTAAAEAGVETIYKVGGAQAIAALAYGTETIDKVDKIVGPGNAFVARAKKWVFGDVAIDMIAGPSEILVLADETAPTKYVAADLLSQAEHDESARSICVTTNERYAQELKQEVTKQLGSLERKEIAEQSIEQNGRIIIAADLKEAFEVVNLIAPEHLQLMIESPAEYVDQVKHAGAIFLGNYSPEPLGDYFAGPNHTLPTSGTARFASPLGVYDFMKKSSIIRYSKEQLQQSADSIINIANVEGLTAHAKSIQMRKDDE